MPDLTSLAASLGALLKAQGHTVAVAESAAGGLISAALVAEASRRGVLHMPDEAYAGMRASTEPYALLNARTIRDHLGATWGLAETGASGPTGNRYGDAAGHACIAVAGPVERTLTVETRVADREANMWIFTRAALELLEACLKAR